MELLMDITLRNKNYFNYEKPTKKWNLINVPTTSFMRIYRSIPDKTRNKTSCKRIKKSI